jgi:hypothetical protein
MKTTANSYDVPEPANGEIRDANLGPVAVDVPAGIFTPTTAEEQLVADHLVAIGAATLAKPAKS